MDPAVGVENILRYILGVDAVDGVADVLPRRHDQTEGYEHHNRDAVVQTENGRVDVDVADLDQVLQPPKHVEHLFSECPRLYLYYPPCKTRGIAGSHKSVIGVSRSYECFERPH